MQAFLQTAVVVEKTPAALFDDLAIAIDRTGPAMTLVPPAPITLTIAPVPRAAMRLITASIGNT